MFEQITNALQSVYSVYNDEEQSSGPNTGNTSLILSVLSATILLLGASYKYFTAKSDKSSEQDLDYIPVAESDEDISSEEELSAEEMEQLLADQSTTDFTWYNRETARQQQENDGYTHTSAHERNASQYGGAQMWKRYM